MAVRWPSLWKRLLCKPDDPSAVSGTQSLGHLTTSPTTKLSTSSDWGENHIYPLACNPTSKMLYENTHVQRHGEGVRCSV